MSNPGLIILFYKLGNLFAGVFISYLGYQLFKKGIFDPAGELQVTFNNKRILLRKAAPGTFFSLLGAGIIIVSLYQGFSVEDQHVNNQNSLTSPVIIKPDLK